MTNLTFNQVMHKQHIDELIKRGADSNAVYIRGIPNLQTRFCDQLVGMGCATLEQDDKRDLYKLTPEAHGYEHELETGLINDPQRLAERVDTCALSLLGDNSGAYVPALLHLLNADKPNFWLDLIKAYFKGDKDLDGEAVRTWRAAAHYGALYHLLSGARFSGTHIKAGIDSAEQIKYKGAQMTAFDLHNLDVLETFFADATGKKPPAAFVINAALLSLVLLIKNQKGA